MWSVPSQLTEDGGRNRRRIETAFGSWPMAAATRGAQSAAVAMTARTTRLATAARCPRKRAKKRPRFEREGPSATRAPAERSGCVALTSAAPRR